MKIKVSIFIFFWCQCIAYALLAYEYAANGGGKDNMSVEGIIAIVVALIGVAGGIWAQIIQFKKDRQRIESVNETSKDVKSDTSMMAPQVNNINAKTETIYSDISRTVLPAVTTIQQLSGGMNELVENLHFEEKINNKASSDLPQPDIMKGYINALYEKNSVLNDRVLQLEKEKTVLKNEVTRFKSEYNQLVAQNTSLNQEITSLIQEINSIKFANDRPDLSPSL